MKKCPYCDSDHIEKIDDQYICLNCGSLFKNNSFISAKYQTQISKEEYIKRFNDELNKFKNLNLRKQIYEIFKGVILTNRQTYYLEQINFAVSLMDKYRKEYIIKLILKNSLIVIGAIFILCGIFIPALNLKNSVDWVKYLSIPCFCIGIFLILLTFKFFGKKK